MIGIISAMEEEISSLLLDLRDPQKIESGMRTYYIGTLYDLPTVIAFSRWGKVAAAATVSKLILEFKVDEIYFTGVAGAISDDLSVGDIVVAKRLYQHDMDVRPILKKYEIPLLNKLYFETGKELRELAIRSAEIFKSKISSYIDSNELKEFSIDNPKVVAGNIASGDKFITHTKDRDTIKNELKVINCVEMEGAAVAQICYEYDIPYAVIRIISDSADEKSAIDFTKFIESIATKYSKGIIRELYNLKQL